MVINLEKLRRQLPEKYKVTHIVFGARAEMLCEDTEIYLVAAEGKNGKN